MKNNIHPTAIIEKGVLLGTNNTILPYTIIYKGVEIGDNNIIGPFSVVGVPATDSKKIDSKSPRISVKIGNNNIIREFCVIEKPCYEKISIIKNNAFLMQGVHLSHDNIIEDNVVITNACIIGGIAKILEGANLGMACTINQYTIIGQYSITATNSACMKNVRPFSRYIPNKPISVNYYAINKYHFEEYTKEIENYVLENIKPSSERIGIIVSVFEDWVNKYGHSTY